MSSTKNTLTIATSVIAVLVIIGSGYLTWQLLEQKKQIEMLMVDRNFFLNENSSSTRALAIASSTITELETELHDLKEEYGVLTDDYQEERGRNEDFEDQIKDISKTVGVLDKLSKTDKELLQKYSKVYFLNEHYIPEKLSDIEKTYLYNEDNDQQLHSKVMPFFEEMVKDAKEDGIEIWAISAYRSFETQAQLKGAYTITYGSGANTFSADQGFSEHQLGTTVDLTTTGLGGGLSGFQNTPAYEWLKENAHRYGFTLSYPEDNGYYVFEPWHWRFVGEDLAKDLHRDNETFYNWEQRKIDEYLIKVFD
jgi:D-alanyl-D-alanine carboxypeptidase